MVKLRSHQQKSVNMFRKTRGLILNHGMGSGKTLTSIACAEDAMKNKPNLQIHVAVPAKLVSNYEKELAKANANTSKYIIMSHDKYIKWIQPPYSNILLIVDEAHILRNATTEKSKVFFKVARYCYKVLLLTGTPLVNYPSDASHLLNMIKGNKFLPTDQKIFNTKFIKTSTETNFFPFTKKITKINIIKKKELAKAFKNHISCIKTTIKDFPSVSYTYRRVDMSPQQYLVYRDMEREYLSSKAKRIMAETGSSQVLNTFMNKTRQISNIIKNHKRSPKINAIKKQIKNDNMFPVLIYSFFLDAGVNPMFKTLSKKYKCKRITGDTNKLELEDITKKYNTKKLDILLISGAAGFGLDLKRTMSIHIMEPTWNKANIDQVIGRGVRYKSHIDLPEKKRHVKVYHWLSVIPKSLSSFVSKPRPSADEYLYEISLQKSKLLEEYGKVICDSISASGGGVSNDIKSKNIYSNFDIHQFINMY
uniref:SNF2 family N-terminal domain protein n=1 Tax=Megaviridae environmental sample TaxID=1737588 RepID=A0A5J6VJP7_9VIRU|nr:MAG: SNF2 family N-terminal domain protein [Megaviridae environmental sample]